MNFQHTELQRKKIYKERTVKYVNLIIQQLKR